MKHRPRYVLALTLIATTLCADRLFASDRTLPENRQPAERLVARLTRSFARSVRTSPLVVQRHIANPPPSPIAVLSTEQSFCLPLSPVQFRLPPPLL